MTSEISQTEIIMQKASIRIIKVAWAKNSKGKIFGAFRWNPFVISMYEDIFQEIKNKYGWDIQYGAEHLLKIDEDLGEGIKMSDIKQLIDRNKQLYDIFVDGISSCDIFIADITNHNPNVFLELGIAIQQNKNILVVTNQDLDDLPFDIRGFEAKMYHTKEELQKLIEKEIEMYTLIKDQNFESEKFISKYQPKSDGVVTNHNSVKIDVPKLKNLRIKIDFRFLYSTNHKLDWFGVHLRSQGPSRYFSELVLVRYTGETRSLTWPEQRKENDGKKVDGFKPEDWHTLEVLIDENMLTAWVHQQLVIEDPHLITENFGEIFISCNDHPHTTFFEDKTEGKKNENNNYLEVEFKNIEILDLNTTANLF